MGFVGEAQNPLNLTPNTIINQSIDHSHPESRRIHQTFEHSSFLGPCKGTAFWGGHRPMESVRATPKRIERTCRRGATFLHQGSICAQSRRAHHLLHVRTIMIQLSSNIVHEPSLGWIGDFIGLKRRERHRLLHFLLSFGMVLRTLLIWKCALDWCNWY